MAVQFTRAIQALRDTPIPVDAWQQAQVGDANDGPYKSGYPQMRVVDSGEPLVDVSRFGLVSSDFYLDRLLLGDSHLRPALEQGHFWSRAYLRESHARRLARADAYLRENGLFLFVASGWRSPQLQGIIKAAYAAEHGEERAGQVFASVTPGQAPPPHSTGAAFDLEVWSLQGSARLEMYYRHQNQDIYSGYVLERMSASHSAAGDDRFDTALRNRRILHHVLCTRGVVFARDEELFCAHPGEFWHFGDGDPLSAYLSRQPVARYGLTQPASP